MKYKKMISTGFILMLIGHVFFLAETLYFGSNWYHGSVAELYCDYAASLITGAGMGIISYAFATRLVESIKEINKRKDETN